MKDSIREVLKGFQAMMRARGTITERILAVNQNRDFLIKTEALTYYLKNQREPKMVTPPSVSNGEKKTIYLTINEELYDKHAFDVLVIFLGTNQAYYYIRKERIKELGYISTNPIQNETAMHIPIKEMKRFVTLDQEA